MKTNRLIDEKSPYLLQHAYNPVDWYAWGEAAFEAARREDRPIFLSIGYSTCHWCHVMEHESFEDEAVAALMNEAFINIKVDREERPDIDGIYMTVCQMLTGHGGWPLTILMTPDKEPFFAATYIPKQSRYGGAGMLDLIPRIREVWTREREKVLHSAGQITEALRQGVTQDLSGDLLGAGALAEGYRQLADRFDPVFGGFGQAPKFPTPHNLTFLLREGYRTQQPRALDMVEATLQGLRMGGVYDHIGYGFHRYSTDQQWLLPHFEKMLYDQAGLVMAFTEAYQATRNPVYEQTARDILTYVRRDMTSPEGGFYSAEDADSEGVEGKFYVWTLDELREVLGPEGARVVSTVYNIEPEGNFEDEATGHRSGANIPHLTHSFNDLADSLNMDEEELAARLETYRQRLFEHRETRVHPHKDDKILTDWNGLMIAAFARAARVFDDLAYTRAARRAVQFVLDHLRSPDGRLLHRYREGEAALQANLDDYAFFIHGLIECYQTTFDVGDLRLALKLNQTLIDHFAAEGGGFYFTPDDGEDLLVRQRELYDGAVPSGNSIAMLNLLRLARLTGRADLEDRAEALARSFTKPVAQMPSGHTQMLSALGFAIGPSYEVVIVGDPQAEDTRAMLRALRGPFVPNKVVLLKRSPDDEALTELAPFVEGQYPLDGKATAYVCRNFACDRPTTNPDVMLASLGVEP